MLEERGRLLKFRFSAMLQGKIQSKISISIINSAKQTKIKEKLGFVKYDY